MPSLALVIGGFIQQRRYNIQLDNDGFIQQRRYNIQLDTTGFIQQRRYNIQLDTGGFIQQRRYNIQLDNGGFIQQCSWIPLGLFNSEGTTCSWIPVGYSTAKAQHTAGYRWVYSKAKVQHTAGYRWVYSTAKVQHTFSWLLGSHDNPLTKSLLGPEPSSFAWSTGVQLMIYFCFRFSVVLFGRPGISICHTTRCICLCFFIVLKPDIFVYNDDSLMS